MMSRQMRVSDAQYKVLSDLMGKTGMKRTELLNNALALLRFLVEQEARGVKAVCENGTEKELYLTLLLGNKE